MKEKKQWHKKNIFATFAAVFLFIALLAVGLWQLVPRLIKTTETTTDNVDLKQFLDLSEDQFLDVFNLPAVEDPEENKRRAQALKQHQQEVLENNEAYLAGNQTWFDEINEYSDLPEDEFEANHTGLITNGTLERRFMKYFQ